MGYYVVELDGEPDALNGGSDGSVRIEHNKVEPVFIYQAINH